MFGWIDTILEGQQNCYTSLFCEFRLGRDVRKVECRWNDQKYGVWHVVWLTSDWKLDTIIICCNMKGRVVNLSITVLEINEFCIGIQIVKFFLSKMYFTLFDSGTFLWRKIYLLPCCRCYFVNLPGILMWSGVNPINFKMLSKLRNNFLCNKL